MVMACEQELLGDVVQAIEDDAMVFVGLALRG